MKTAEIRESFLRFFEEKGCRRFPSSSLIPDDPSLLLANAGMNQFKQYYLGKKTMEEIGACSCQKCLRTNDIENIGHDGRHLSFFEMLGNFSFGGYTKKQACQWAFEFVTSPQYLGLPLDKLYFTVYTEDDEGFDIWREIGVPADHISRLGADDNFWAAGPTGPCGPCSEIYYDQGPEVGCGRPDCHPGCDCDRFLEFWNLVFTQYDRQEDGTLLDLPHRNIDTGMGLERISAIMQGKSTNYDGDIMSGLIEVGERLAGVTYNADPKVDSSLRILADHARAVTFMIGDGILPSNEGRGYVLRRLLRRAIYHGRMLGIQGSFMGAYIDEVVDVMGGAYPEIVENSELIHRIAKAEEDRFSATLRTGKAYLQEALDALAPGEQLDGATAFRLHDTFGFPFDLTVEAAAEAGHGVDQAGFDAAMDEQRSRARAQVKDVVWGKFDTVWVALADKFKSEEFVGYDQDCCETIVRALVRGDAAVDGAAQGDEVDVLLEQTPFYAEMGGQVGDTGTIRASDGSFELQVLDTTRAERVLSVHHCRVVSGTVEAGAQVVAQIDVARRERIRRNHTATHILQAALRQVLGTHVNQAGSLVEPDRLRFDFTHFQAMTPDEISEVERICNDVIMRNLPVTTRVCGIDEARASGAMALFGEKYGDVVRVVDVKGFSRELCGGTHVSRTSEIGLLKVVSEGSAAANTRRIEAVTSFDALAFLDGQQSELRSIADELRVPVRDAAKKVADLQESVRKYEEDARRARRADAAQKASALLDDVIDAGFPLVVARVDGLDAEGLRGEWDLIRERLSAPGACVLGTVSPSGSPLLLAAGTDEAVAAGFHAGKLIKSIAPRIHGGGGGRPQMAQAGGSDASGLDAALQAARAELAN
ncbi:MAG: alanine--tRNA ligase [Coriobacteriales bacterium]